jgi:hypothetical protein
LTDLVLIPLSSGTGSSLKTIEAMAAGKLVLGTTVAFRGLAVPSGVHALIEDSIDRYRKRIRTLLNDKPVHVRLATAARQLATGFDFRTYGDLLGLPEPEQSSEALGAKSLDTVCSN